MSMGIMLSLSIKFRQSTFIASDENTIRRSVTVALNGNRRDRGSIPYIGVTWRCLFRYKKKKSLTFFLLRWNNGNCANTCSKKGPWLLARILLSPGNASWPWGGGVALMLVIRTTLAEKNKVSYIFRKPRFLLGMIYSYSG